MVDAAEMLGSACWISGPAFAYGADDAGYYAIDDEALRTQVVSTTFELAADEVAGATFELAVAVLGLARVTINGQALPVELLGHWTRFDKLVYTDTFAVGELLHAGTNRIAIELGNGFYNPAPLTLFGKYNLRERLAEVGTPAVAAALVQNGKRILATDETWVRFPAGAYILHFLYYLLLLLYYYIKY